MLSPFAVPDYLTRGLTEADVDTLQELLERCSEFNLLVTGEAPHPSSALELLDDRPPDTPPENKFVYGIFSAQNRLVGVMDIVRDYPSARIWWVGLLLLDPAARGKGLGRKIFNAFERWAAEHGAGEIRLGVVERNEKALRFWEGLGLQVIQTRPPVRMGKLEQRVHVLAKLITA